MFISFGRQVLFFVCLCNYPVDIKIVKELVLYKLIQFSIAQALEMAKNYCPSMKIVMKFFFGHSQKQKYRFVEICRSALHSFLIFDNFLYYFFLILRRIQIFQRIKECGLLWNQQNPLYLPKVM